MNTPLADLKLDIILTSGARLTIFDAIRAAFTERSDFDELLLEIDKGRYAHYSLVTVIQNALSLNEQYELGDLVTLQPFPPSGMTSNDEVPMIVQSKQLEYHEKDGKFYMQFFNFLEGGLVWKPVEDERITVYRFTPRTPKEVQRKTDLNRLVEQIITPIAQACHASNANCASTFLHFYQLAMNEAYTGLEDWWIQEELLPPGNPRRWAKVSRQRRTFHEHDESMTCSQYPNSISKYDDQLHSKQPMLLSLPAFSQSVRNFQ